MLKFYSGKARVLLVASFFVLTFAVSIVGKTQLVQAAPRCYVENSATGAVEQLPKCDKATLESTGFVIGAAVEPASNNCYYWTKDSTVAGTSVACNLAQIVNASKITSNIITTAQTQGNNPAAVIAAIAKAQKAAKDAADAAIAARNANNPTAAAAAVARAQQAAKDAAAAAAAVSSNGGNPTSTTIAEAAAKAAQESATDAASTTADTAAAATVDDSCNSNSDNAERDKVACCSAVNDNGTPGDKSDDYIDEAKLQACLKQNPLVKNLLLFVNFLSAGVGIIVTVMIIIGGIQYVTAGSNPQQVAVAKKRIMNALIALIAYGFMFAFLQWLVPGGIF
ncbi:MAG: pilin [Candidatus Saccharimonadales bacterium]